MKDHRRDISNGSFIEMLNRARNADGQVCCTHCSDPITDRQILTVQHLVPLSTLKERTPDEICEALELDEIAMLPYADLSAEEKYRFAKKKLNEPINIRPMHVACHQEADGFKTFTPEQAEYYNLKPEYRPADFKKPLFNQIERKSDKEVRAKLAEEPLSVVREVENELNTRVQQLTVHIEFGVPKTQVTGVKHPKGALSPERRLEKLEAKLSLVQQILAEREEEVAAWRRS